MVYLLIRKNIKLIQKLIDIDSQLAEEMSSDMLDNEKIDRYHKKIENLLKSCQLKELRAIYTVFSVGLHERGYREFSSGYKTEIIELEVKENEEQLLSKYSKYIFYCSKEELEKYLAQQTSIATPLREGLKILKMS